MAAGDDHPGAGDCVPGTVPIRDGTAYAFAGPVDPFVGPPTPESVLSLKEDSRAAGAETLTIRLLTWGPPGPS